MDIHEYQAKEILQDFGVRIPRGGLAYSPEQAAYRAREVGGSRWVVKAQVHTGGRHNVGGVILCDSENEVYNATERLLGKRLVTDQSGPMGKVVYRVYVEAFVSVASEFYIGFVLDRKVERIMVVASESGGIEIQEIAEQNPDSIIRTVVEPAVGMQVFQAREIAFKLGVEPSQVNELVETILGCCQAFEQLDATMVEINPLVVTEDAGVFALDAKMTFDDNALFRRPEIAELRDKSQEDQHESRAADRGMKYVGLDGDIGCIVNGGGLAMATIDSIEIAGGKPANFLDTGGGASPERVAKAFRLVLGDENIKAVLVNVFAGVNRCDWIAEGIIQALERDPIQVPLVVRLAGTRVDEGRKLLAKSGLPVIRANTLAEAAERVVAAAKSSKSKRVKSKRKAAT
ncbi:MAG: malate--CoA ligase subunit beta [Granulosicoccus sp.]|nr:malate--CoA ligase subunit beta [Granulosicoccus sp.]